MVVAAIYIKKEVLTGLIFLLLKR